MTTTAPKILADLAKADGLIYFFNRENGSQNFAGYDPKKMEEITSFMAKQGYVDYLNYNTYRPGFCDIIYGTPTMTREERSANAQKQIAAMDQATLARFGAFIIQSERQPGFAMQRMQDGTFAAMIARIEQLGPRAVAPVAVVASAPTPNGAVA